MITIGLDVRYFNPFRIHQLIASIWWIMKKLIHTFGIFSLMGKTSHTGPVQVIIWVNSYYRPRTKYDGTLFSQGSLLLTWGYPSFWSKVPSQPLIPCPFWAGTPVSGPMSLLGDTPVSGPISPSRTGVPPWDWLPRGLYGSYGFQQ